MVENLQFGREDGLPFHDNAHYVSEIFIVFGGSLRKGNVAGSEVHQFYFSVKGDADVAESQVSVVNMHEV